MEYGFGECATCAKRFRKRMHNHKFCSLRCWKAGARSRQYVPLYQFPYTAELVAAYEGGAPVLQLAAKYGVSWQRVRAVLRRAGVVDPAADLGKQGCS